MIIDTKNTLKTVSNFWSGFHFHPTDAIEDDWGRRILDQAAQDKVADMVRMYAMLEDIVTMDEKGNLHYDFTLNDQRLDYMLTKGWDIFLSYNFMPACIASDPTENSSVSKNKTRYKGKMIITSPPRDYKLWEEVCYRYTRHIVDRYGVDVVSRWYLQCFNEPDIACFFMKNATLEERAQEYIKLYRAFSHAVTRVSPRLQPGGPALAFEDSFLDSVLSAIRTENMPIRFICFHTYGTSVSRLNDGSKPFDIHNTLALHEQHMKIVARYFPALPVIVDEWGASAQGFFNVEECPPLMFRETSAFAAYYGKMIALYVERSANLKKMLICLSGQHEMTVNFSGFRNFFTLDFIRKPIYNAYVLMRRMGTEIIDVFGTDDELTGLTARNEKGDVTCMLAYASRHFDEKLPDMDETVTFDGVSGTKQVTVWCIDEAHVNPYEVFCQEGMTEPLTQPQIDCLRAVGRLCPVWTGEIAAENGQISVPVHFTNNALLMVELH